MPKPIIYVLITLAFLAMLPPALIARARTRTTQARRIHFIQDMDNQSKLEPQEVDAMFADDRSMRPVVAGTVARGELDTDDHYDRGLMVVNGVEGWAMTTPAQVPLTMRLLEHGQERFTIYCSPCHGEAGYGNGMVHVRAQQLVENPMLGSPDGATPTGTVWVQPKSVHDADIRVQPIGQIFNTITNGVRTMSGYAAQVPLDDRWAIAAYVKALQRSQHAEPGDVTPSERANLQRFDMVPRNPDEEGAE